jgi:hypothetical protein
MMTHYMRAGGIVYIHVLPTESRRRVRVSENKDKKARTRKQSRKRWWYRHCREVGGSIGGWWEWMDGRGQGRSGTEGIMEKEGDVSTGREKN